MSIKIDSASEAKLEQTLQALALKNSLLGETGKAQLKELLLRLVDQQKFPPPAPTTPPQPLSLVEQVQLRLGRRSCTSKPGVLSSRKAPTSHQSTARPHNAHFSELGRSQKTITFGHAKRQLDLALDRSPGPAYYSYSTSTLESRPAISIPTDSKVDRSSFLTSLNDSPSPSHYYPSKHFTS